MEKPRPETIVRYDWVDCERYIEEKLGSFYRENREEFQSIILNETHHNGCDLTLPLDEECDWKPEDENSRKIIAAFAEEFGPEALYYFWW